MTNNGYFVTGTDTGVGKTVVSAILCAGMQAAYWKPVQTGTMESRDSDFVKAWSPKLFPEVYSFREPLSPHAAADLENVEISLAKILFSIPNHSGPLIVEGAGGVLVPLNKRHFMIDLIQGIGLPALVVSRSSLGTINHTLLTLDALTRRGVAVVGVVMVGSPNRKNRDAIEKFGAVPVIGEVPIVENFTRSWMFNEFDRFVWPEQSLRSDSHVEV